MKQILFDAGTVEAVLAAFGNPEFIRALCRVGDQMQSAFIALEACEGFRSALAAARQEEFYRQMSCLPAGMGLPPTNNFRGHFPRLKAPRF